MDEKIIYRHYIKVDENDLILWGWSDGSIADPPDGAICINENGTQAFRLFADGADNPQLHDQDFIPLYRWDGEQVVARADAEIEEARQHIFRKIGWTHMYVLDSNNIKTNFVAGDLYRNALGEERYEPERYIKKEGETFLPYDFNNQPIDRTHTGSSGFVKNKWTGSEWVEGATPEEIAAWELDHPAPPAREPSVTEINTQAIAELSIAQAQSDAVTQQALAELSILIAGGMENV